MRTLPSVLLFSLAACSPDDEDVPVDTSDNSAVATDTSDTDSGDTSDSGDTGAASSSPYAHCEEVGVSTGRIRHDLQV